MQRLTELAFTRLIFNLTTIFRLIHLATALSLHFRFRFRGAHRVHVALHGGLRHNKTQVPLLLQNSGSPPVTSSFMRRCGIPAAAQAALAVPPRAALLAPAARAQRCEQVATGRTDIRVSVRYY